jgi:hypothetical protein
MLWKRNLRKIFFVLSTFWVRSLKWLAAGWVTGVEFPAVLGITCFYKPSHPDRVWGRPCLLSNGYLGLIPQSCVVECKTDFNTKVKNEALPPLHAMVLRHRGTLLIFFFFYYMFLDTVCVLATGFSVYMIRLSKSLDTLCDGCIKSCRNI